MPGQGVVFYSALAIHNDKSDKLQLLTTCYVQTLSHIGGGTKPPHPSSPPKKKIRVKRNLASQGLYFAEAPCEVKTWLARLSKTFEQGKFYLKIGISLEKK
jgi:hypothetical protein